VSWYHITHPSLHATTCDTLVLSSKCRQIVRLSISPSELEAHTAPASSTAASAHLAANARATAEWHAALSPAAGSQQRATATHIWPQKQFGPTAGAVGLASPYFLERVEPHGLCCFEFVKCRFPCSIGAMPARSESDMLYHFPISKQGSHTCRTLKQSVHTLKSYSSFWQPRQCKYTLCNSVWPTDACRSAATMCTQATPC
jgi:hypothetical protein